MPFESRAATAWRQAEASLADAVRTAQQSYNRWVEEQNNLNSKLNANPPRSTATVRKQRKTVEKKREIYENARDRRNQEEARRNEARRRVQAEEAASSRMNGDVGVMVAEQAYPYRNQFVGRGNAREY